jgi:hypothetical protein
MITKPIFGDIGRERVISLTYIVLVVVTILCTQKHYESLL